MPDPEWNDEDEPAGCDCYETIYKTVVTCDECGNDRLMEDMVRTFDDTNLCESCHAQDQRHLDDLVARMTLTRRTA